MWQGVCMDTQVAMSAFFALASAICFAFSTSLQHRVAGDAPHGGGLVGIMRFVVTRKVWLFGAVMGFVALILHALALNKGAIALVQPIIVSAVPLAVVFRAALDRTLPPRRELLGVTVTMIALGTFLVISDTTAENVADDRRALIFWAVSAAGAVLLVVAASRIPKHGRAAFVLGMASGVCFGLTAGMLKMLSNDFGADGVIGVFTTWHLLALIISGVAGVAINQRSYQLAPLSTSMPVLNVVDVLIALAFGIVVFGEVPTTDPLGIFALAVCLVLMGLGLRMLAHAPPGAPNPPNSAAEVEDADSEIGRS